MFFVCFGIVILIGSLVWLFFPTIKKFIPIIKKILKKFRSDLNENVQIENDITKDEENKDIKFKSEFDLLLEVVPNQTIRYISESKKFEGQIKAVVKLEPLTQEEDDFKRKIWKGKAESPSLVIITDSFWILNVPGQEGPKRVCLMMNLVEGIYGNLMSFYVGEKDNPERYGPAKRFRKGRQINFEKYSFPSDWNLFPGKTFSIVDIGAFEIAEIKGNSNNVFVEEGFFAFVTSIGDNNDWLFSFLPKAESGFKIGGDGALLVGERIDEKYIEIPY